MATLLPEINIPKTHQKYQQKYKTKPKSYKYAEINKPLKINQSKDTNFTVTLFERERERERESTC
jgi:hypothetical protein